MSQEASQNQERHTKDLLYTDFFKKGLKYLALSLPFLFISPIVLTIGFKILNRDGIWWVLIIGGVLMLITLLIMVQAFRLILKYLFKK